MKRNERQKLLTRFTSGAGGAIGATIGTVLGGPLGAAIGGVAGVALPWAFDAAPSQALRAPIIGPWLRQRAAALEVKRKLQLEFGASAPADSVAALTLLQKEAALIAETPEFTVPDAALRLPQSPAASPLLPVNSIEMLRDANPIRLVSPSICPAIVSTFKLLAIRFQQAGIDLQIDFSPANSGVITKRYPSERWNFCAMCRLAIVATDGKVDKLLRPIAPLYSVSQYMLCRPVLRRETQARRVLIVKDSPSEAQYWLQQNVHRGATIDYIAQAEIIRIAETLRDDEYIIIWEPAASFMEREYDLEMVKDTEFKFLISLLVSAEWAAKYGDHRVSAFYNAFRREWDFGSQNLDGMLWLLTSDSAYLNAFCSSTGIPL